MISVSKWRLLDDMIKAREPLGISSREIPVVRALIGKYRFKELTPGIHMIIFASNATLASAANGMPESTMRRHLGSLVKAGLIQRRNSPNGKRYAKKRGGEVVEAFGFDLRPLLDRASEIALLARQVEEDEEHLAAAKKRLKSCRLGVKDMICHRERNGANEKLEMVKVRYDLIMTNVPRSPNLQNVEVALNDMKLLQLDMLRQRVIELAGEDCLDADVQQISGPDVGKELTEDAFIYSSSGSLLSNMVRNPIIDLQAVITACPQIGDYGPDGGITSWHDLARAAETAKTALSIKPSAYIEAGHVMGRIVTSVTIACILERGDAINSAGAYLRDLTQKFKQGHYAVEASVLALLRRPKPGMEAFPDGQT